MAETETNEGLSGRILTYFRKIGSFVSEAERANVYYGNEDRAMPPGNVSEIYASILHTVKTQGSEQNGKRKQRSNTVMEIE
jgi:hypothetical protein